jgi:hypothetical protein
MLVIHGAGRDSAVTFTGMMQAAADRAKSQADR